MSLEISFKTTKKASSFAILNPAVSQPAFISDLEANAEVPRGAHQFPFTTTRMASVTGPILYTTGEGVFNPTQITRLLITKSHKLGISVVEMKDKFDSYLRNWTTDHTRFLAVISMFLGNPTRLISANKVAQQSMTSLHDVVKRTVPVDPEYGIFVDIMTDFIADKLNGSDFKWLTKGYRTVHELSAGASFMRYHDMVDAVAGAHIKRILDAMTMRNLSVAETYLKQDDSRNISAVLIAQALEGAISAGLARVKGDYLAEQVVDSALYLLHQVWTPDLNKEAKAPDQILEADIINELSQDLSIFLIYQERRNMLVQLEPFFDPNTIKSDILPLLSDAMNDLLPFKKRRISDVNDTISTHVLKDYNGRPRRVVLNENLQLANRAPVFSRTSLATNNERRILIEEVNVTDQVTAALLPVVQEFDLQSLVNLNLEVEDALTSETTVAPFGTKLELLFPSFLGRSLTRDLSLQTVQEGLLAYNPSRSAFKWLHVPENEIPTDMKEAYEKDVESLPAMFKDKEQRKAIATVMHDHYCLLMHLAVAASQGTEITLHGSGVNMGILAIRFIGHTDQIKPLAQSQIINGSFRTLEPTEMLIYSRERQATTALELKNFTINDYEHDSVHGWDWSSVSRDFTYSTSYVTQLRGGTYKVDLNERSMLGLPIQRRGLRMFQNIGAENMTRLWIASMMTRIAKLRSQAKSVKDDVKSEAYKGRINAMDSQLVRLLVRISNAPIGQRTVGYILSAIQTQMYNLGSVDDYSSLTVGAQELKMRTIVGIHVLMFLGLLEDSDGLDLATYVESSGVLSTILAQELTFS